MKRTKIVVSAQNRLLKMRRRVFKIVTSSQKDVEVVQEPTTNLEKEIAENIILR